MGVSSWTERANGLAKAAGRGLLIAAPASGSGKTTVTLALLRVLRSRNVAVGSVKVGPDYIDPAFHTAASGKACVNVDSWAMRPALLSALVTRCAMDSEFVIGEGVMGLFDGTLDGSGSTADVAMITGWPVVLVVDASGMANSAAALIHGFSRFRPEVLVAGVIFNRVGSAAHGRLLREACAPLGIPVLGCLAREPQLELPDRHLGLVQAAEHPELQVFLDRAAEWLESHVDIDALLALAEPPGMSSQDLTLSIPVLGQRIAVAQDSAFAFSYGFVLDGWRNAGVELSKFSPLADEPPDAKADAVYLPGGYPELHVCRIAANHRFLKGLRDAADRGTTIYGECGGYMTLGRGLVDTEGERHAMAGLLPVETSFSDPRITIGYREVLVTADGPLGPRGTVFRGHEFHFARVLSEGGEADLFRCSDASGRALGTSGCRFGSVMGSFIHLIDHCESQGESQ